MTDQVAPPEGSNTAKIVVFWVGVALVVGFFAFFALREDPLISDAKAAVRAMAKDPDSVQFRNETVRFTGDVCGEYNAKNSFGAYVGFRPFVYRKDGSLTLDLDGTLFRILCG